MKEVTTITTIQITAIHKGLDEPEITPVEVVEEEVKDIIDEIFECDDINVKHQIFIREENT